MLTSGRRIRGTSLDQRSAIVDFLIEDFKDTSEHLRASDKKTEFLFQLFYAAVVALASVASLVLTPLLAQTSQSSFVVWLPYLRQLIGVLVVVLWVASLWVLVVVVEGYSEKMMYINRMNFLRKQIWLQFDRRSGIDDALPKRPLFFTEKRPTSKWLTAGVNNLLALGIIFVMVILPWLASLITVQLDRAWGHLPAGVVPATIYSYTLPSALTVGVFLSIIYWRKSMSIIDRAVDNGWGSATDDLGVPQKSNGDMGVPLGPDQSPTA